MHGNMTGWFEVRCDGGNPREHHRVFCPLDYDAPSTDKPLLVVITGMSKPLRTKFTDSDYRKVRELGAEYGRRPTDAYAFCLRARATGRDAVRFAAGFFAPDAAATRGCRTLLVGAAVAEPDPDKAAFFARTAFNATDAFFTSTAVSVVGSGSTEIRSPTAPATSASVDNVGFPFAENNLRTTAGSASIALASCAFDHPSPTRASSSAFTILSIAWTRRASNRYSRRKSSSSRSAARSSQNTLCCSVTTAPPPL